MYWEYKRNKNIKNKYKIGMYINQDVIKKCKYIKIKNVKKYVIFTIYIKNKSTWKIKKKIKLKLTQ